MTMVNVYKVKVFDIELGDYVVSLRMATEKGAAMMHGTILPHTAIEIDKSLLESGEEWTPRGFQI